MMMRQWCGVYDKDHMRELRIKNRSERGHDNESTKPHFQLVDWIRFMSISVSFIKLQNISRKLNGKPISVPPRCISYIWLKCCQYRHCRQLIVSLLFRKLMIAASVFKSTIVKTVNVEMQFMLDRWCSHQVGYIQQILQRLVAIEITRGLVSCQHHFNCFWIQVSVRVRTTALSRWGSWHNLEITLVTIDNNNNNNNNKLY